MIKPSLRTAEIGCVRPMLGCIMETTMWRALILVAAADMSAFENYQPHALALQKAMSALPPIATAKADMPQIAVSAFPPTADMCNATSNVGYGPIADIGRNDLCKKKDRLAAVSPKIRSIVLIRLRVQQQLFASCASREAPTYRAR